MKLLFLVIITTLISLSSKSQTTNSNEVQPIINGELIDTTKTLVVVNPEYPGGINRFHSYLKDHIIYPKEAKKNRIKGDVKVSFVIDPDGKVTDVKVVEGIGGGCDEEVVRVVSSSRRWLPAIHNFKKIPSKQEVIFTFK